VAERAGVDIFVREDIDEAEEEGREDETEEESREFKDGGKRRILEAMEEEEEGEEG
jgi:hypothetical protein